MGGVHRDLPPRRPSYVYARYYDRPDLIRHTYRHTHAYYDDHFRLHYRVIWPYYYYSVYYPFGSYGYYHPVYPYYHRKYVFVSLGGFWPSDYFYLRYYWYGWHPYVWYGYYPVPREVTGDSYTYYTYNYYSQGDDGTYTSAVSEAPAQNEVVEQSTWADVRQKLDQQNEKPIAPTVADARFEEGVKSFESGNYRAAAERFEEAMRLSPEDTILPFAYAQSLFADGKYTESAAILRQALSKVTPDKEGVFYPRGLYANDDVLYGQIEKLVGKLENFGYDADMQLLLGYHLLGTGETGYAREPLGRASQDLENAQAAQILLKLADKIESEAKTMDEAGGNVEKSDAASSSEATTPSDVQTPSGAAQPSSVSGAAFEETQFQATPEPEKAIQAAEPNLASPSAEPQGGGAAPVVPGIAPDSSEGGTSSSDSAGEGIVDSPSVLLAGLGRYLRVDLAIYVGIVLLGWTGVYVQWRLPDRV